MNTSRFERLFSTPEMGAVFSDRARVQAMLDFEAALAQAEARLALIPTAAAERITAACRADQFDLDGLAELAAEAGNPAIPLIEALTAKVASADPKAAKYVHLGATSQDAIDTGAMLQLRAALALIATDLERLCAALADLARRHRRTVLAGRTFLQHAVPVTLGLKAAGWLSGLTRAQMRLNALREQALCLQLGGAGGNLSVLGGRGLAVAEALADALSLVLPELPWHTQRDRVAEIGAAIGILIGSLGKLARDLSLLMQTELGEVREPTAPGRGGSSAMPHKQNPVACTIALAAAARAPGLVSTLLIAQLQEHERGLGGWHAEWETLPALCGLAAGALAAMARTIEGLHVDAARMRRNLAESDGGLYTEAVFAALAQRLGRPAAHGLVARCSREARARSRSLQGALLGAPEVRAVLDETDLEALFDPAERLGASDTLIARALAASGRREH